MAKGKGKDALNEDRLKRNLEMAEGKSPKEAAEIYKKGDKYYCAECQSELPYRKSCPVCKKEIDWDRAFIETRR